MPYLKQQEDYGHLVFYTKMLTVHLEKTGKYKESMKVL